MVAASRDVPHLLDLGHTKQLIVNGEPFLMRAAELQNSSSSSARYMRQVWPKIVEMNINTVLASVTWEMIEPEEGLFDFFELDSVISDARSFGLKLILLWFGSFKNGLSTYAPPWVKRDYQRFPRAQLRNPDGSLRLADTASPFSEMSARTDANAFGALMKHLRRVDEEYSTVVMVQVENEPGLLGDSRDRSPSAEEQFRKPVPDNLLQFLSEDWHNLHEDLRANLGKFWSPGCDRVNKSWEDVFGKGEHTDELFMAYGYSRYIDQVAAAGKQQYQIPLYTNAWLNYAADADANFPVVAGGGGRPGDYPSGGAVSKVLDVWLKYAPSLDFVAPDLYLNDYTNTCAAYRHRNQPLFIPEQRRDEYGARRIWKAIGSFQALATAPFGIDTLEPTTCAFTKHYGLLKSISPTLLEAQRRPGSSYGFFFDELRGESKGPGPADVIKMVGFEIRIERSFVFGKHSPGAGMIIHLDGSQTKARFLLCGWGFQAVFKSLDPAALFTGILSFHEKIRNEGTGRLETLRVFNGDETGSGACARMPSEAPDDGGFPISITIPTGTGIAECTVYSLVEQRAITNGVNGYPH